MDYKISYQAIIDVIIKLSPNKVLDIGCGEGWLAKELVKNNIFVMGIDAIPSLIEHVKNSCEAMFDVCTYENLSSYQFNQLFDCVVFNFSLIGKESTEIVIKTAQEILAPNGHLIIQTLHPVAASLDQPYQDGWREGSWAGFNKDFKNPAPWYFRTIESWCDLFKKYGLNIANLYEPVHPSTKKPLSI
jgi:2-polyprenyl-3-methyl-5-hydroxy-6-metoxy-1,4-benzoquinol methylase